MSLLVQGVILVSRRKPFEIQTLILPAYPLSPFLLVLRENPHFCAIVPTAFFSQGKALEIVNNGKQCHTWTLLSDVTASEELQSGLRASRRVTEPLAQRLFPDQDLQDTSQTGPQT